MNDGNFDLSRPLRNVIERTTAGVRPRLAVIATQYGPTNHASAIATKLMEGLEFDGYRSEPRCDVVSMHIVQLHADDVGVEAARRNGVPLHPSVATALCCGGDELAVDGIVFIGEHGDYPLNEKGQKLYPRREIFDQIANVMRQSGRVVPLFYDKHLSWNWAWAKYVWGVVQELDIPLMAGSSLPYSQYVPAPVLPNSAPLDHAVAVGHAGEAMEAYAFHALEMAQCVLERRRGGETGVRRVQCLSGADVWNAHRQGRWPRDIAEAAFGSITDGKGRPQDYIEKVHALDVEYCDGQRLTTLLTGDYSTQWSYAYREHRSDAIVSTMTPLDDTPRLQHFSSLVRSIEDMFVTGMLPAPPERTYLTTGMLSHLIESQYRGGIPVDTPELDIAYDPSEYEYR